MGTCPPLRWGQTQPVWASSSGNAWAILSRLCQSCPPPALPALPAALIAVAGWIYQTKRANGLIDMIWQLICNLIILSRRTHYSLFITLLSSQVCCSCSLRTARAPLSAGKPHGGQERSGALMQQQTKLLNAGHRHICL